jgi:dTDP-4-amino-4,6-dideoxygalactose transaminase
LKLDQIHKTHREVFESLLEQGIGVNLHYIPVHTQPFYKQMGFKDGDFPNAESYYQEAISLPLFPKLSSEQQLKVVAALKMALN